MRASRVAISELVCVCETINIDVCTSHTSYTAPTPVSSGSVHAQILTKSSRAGFAVTRSELVELGAAPCAFRGTWAEAFFSIFLFHNGFSKFEKQKKSIMPNDTIHPSVGASSSSARPTSRAYSDADPGVVCPTAVAADTAAPLLLLLRPP